MIIYNSMSGTKDSWINQDMTANFPITVSITGVADLSNDIKTIPIKYCFQGQPSGNLMSINDLEFYLKNNIRFGWS